MEERMILMGNAKSGKEQRMKGKLFQMVGAASVKERWLNLECIVVYLKLAREIDSNAGKN